ncbi:MAG: hypothetical protein ACTHJ4_02385 [Candidatus Nucleicultricaceae bacterium]
MDPHNQRKEITEFFEALSLMGWDALEPAADRGMDSGHQEKTKHGLYGSPLDGIKSAIAYAYSVIRAHPEFDASMTEPKDRLFDQLMVLFDVFSDDRPGIQVAYKKIIISPCLLREINQDLFDLFSLILQKSNVNVPPIFGAVKVFALEVAVLCMLQTWIEDESEDLSKTLAVVDEKLDLLKDISNFIPWNER